jgi:hypothetical protein
MKAIRHTDGRIEFEGTPEEIARAVGLPGARTAANGSGEHQAPHRLTGPRPAGSRLPGSLPARIAEVFAAESTRTFRLAELAQRLGVPLRSISGTVSRMAREENPLVRSTSRGRYRAVARGDSQ